MGLLAEDGSASDAGVDLLRTVEGRTDALAAASYGGFDVEQIADRLQPIVDRVLAAEVLPFPNPIGVRAR